MCKKLLCVKAAVCVCGFVCVCLYICVNMFLRVCLCLRAYQHICMFVFFTSPITFYTAYLVCLKTRTSSHLLILTSTHNEHLHMISRNILMNIFMQVFGVCKSYSYITHLSTYTPTRSRANHRLVFMGIWGSRKISHKYP